MFENLINYANGAKIGVRITTSKPFPKKINEICKK
jgi:hypothetical protein